ncbi:adenosylcobinamide-GDP ribazoletransferase [Niallia sp. 01092]|uniref:adenosylcobinamide-GDP ribazoletransferase n=1 Tax=unclassified Niallia TaxID=2837522 RepID=UPI003FD4BEAA
MKKVWIGFLLNIQFFTAVPINKTLPMEKEFVSSSIRTFPLLGLLQGLLYSFFVYGLLHFTPFSVLAVSFFLWILMIVITGGLHLDGWMDASDAFFSYQDCEKRLEIMKDPRVGAFGVLSVIVLLSTKLFFVYEIVNGIQAETYFLVLLLPFFSKIVMGTILIRVPEAKKDGLGSFFKRAITGNITAVYFGYVAVCFGIIFLFYQEAFLEILLLMISGAVCYVFLAKKIVKWFGGLTGDLLGAAVEGTELVLWATVWLLHYFVMV